MRCVLFRTYLLHPSLINEQGAYYKHPKQFISKVAVCALGTAGRIWTHILLLWREACYHYTTSASCIKSFHSCTSLPLLLRHPRIMREAQPHWQVTLYPSSSPFGYWTVDTSSKDTLQNGHDFKAESMYYSLINIFIYWFYQLYRKLWVSLA